MSFFQKFGTIIKRLDKKIISLILDDGLTYYNYDENFNLLLKKEIVSGDYSFADVWFDVNKDDSLYGLTNLKNGALDYLYINDKFSIHSEILKYNPNECNIKFPYIKKTDDTMHIFYCLINSTSPYSFSLIHHYKRNDNWIKYEVDYGSYKILSNFVVINDYPNLNVFYFKIVDNFEELFVSSFDLANNKWNPPIQITNSYKNKVYLSVINDSKYQYHILFSENNLGKYYCTYLNGNIKDNNFISSNCKVISETVACSFPNIIEHDSIIYTQWIEYHDLYKSFSTDSGINWSEPIIDNKASEFPFISYSYHSNCNEDKAYNLSNIFALENSTEILGIDN